MPSPATLLHTSGQCHAAVVGLAWAGQQGLESGGAPLHPGLLDFPEGHPGPPPLWGSVPSDQGDPQLLTEARGLESPVRSREGTAAGKAGGDQQSAAWEPPQNKGPRNGQGKRRPEVGPPWSLS